jgi:predicted dehydrogenase
MSSESDLSRRLFLAAAGTSILATAVGRAQPVEPPDRQPADLTLPKDEPKKVGWALVGIGQLCLEQVLPAFAECAKSKPVALVSGHPDKAHQVARHYGIPETSIYNYTNYEKMQENPDIDVVYVILPNSMHAEYTIRALKIAKHVLCEKPMAATADECRQMIDAARQAKKQLAIGYRLHHEPYNLSVMEMTAKRAYGQVKLIEAANVQNTPAPNIRLSKNLAGGSVMDVGIYCINAARYITHEEPIEVTATSYRPKDDPRFREVDESTAFTLKFPSGAIATCTCSLGTATSRRFRVYCEKGYIDLEKAFGYTGQRLKVSDEKSVAEWDLPHVNHFATEMDKFSACVLDGKPTTTPGEEGLRDMIVIEAIAQSLREEKPIRIPIDPSRPNL